MNRAMAGAAPLLSFLILGNLSAAPFRGVQPEKRFGQFDAPEGFSYFSLEKQGKPVPADPHPFGGEQRLPVQGINFYPHQFGMEKEKRSPSMLTWTCQLSSKASSIFSVRFASVCW